MTLPQAVIRKWILFRLSAVLTILAMAGCQKAATEIESQREPDRILQVHAADWGEFVFQEKPSTTGWVAFPADVTATDYTSAVDPRALGIVPAKECAECHAEFVRGFIETAHARTMRRATRESVLGDLTSPHNRIQTGRPGFEFETLEVASHIVHRLHSREPGIPAVLEVPVAFAVGSGNHGQSFLAWHGDQLCQTPVSFLTEANCWGNSPGTYVDGTADFSRPATSRCLDCHNTWFAHAPGSVNRYDKGHFVMGVSCVRCHGAARDHVRYHQQFPADRQAQAIINPRGLSRDRANEVCAQCHSGGGELRRPAFTYQPGEPLEKWIALNMQADAPSNDDPHSANQLGRMMRSACYQRSETLTCMDCHDPHRQERGRTELFSERCQNCHQVADCGLSVKYNDKLSQRCVECHMPSRRDVEVTSRNAGESVMPLLRDHLIGIWPDVSRTIENELGAPQP